MSQTIDVNMTPGLFMPTIYYSQGDIGREFKINITTSDGTAIPAGATVKMQATKPSGLGFSVSGTLSGNVATFTTTETMTNEAGRVPAELVLEANGDRIGTANFYWQGEKDPHPQGTVDGDLDDVMPKYMTVTVTSLAPNTAPTYSYDPATNTANFGIPRGADGSLSSGVLASTYSSSSTYVVGDYVYYNGSLYRCRVDISTAEAWTSKHWEQVALADNVFQLNDDLNNIAKYIVGENLANNNDIVPGFIQSDGTISTAGSYANYVTTDYIELESNTNYVISLFLQSTLQQVSGQRIGTLLFDGEYSPVSASFVNQIDNTRVISSGNYKYIRISFPNVSPNYLYVQIQKGSTNTPYEAYNETWLLKANLELNGEAISQQDAFDAKVSKVKHISKNLINPSEIETGKLIDSNYNLANASSYDTTGFIPVQAGQDIVVSPKTRVYALYDTNKTGIYYNNNTVYTYQTITPSQDGYIRFSLWATDTSTAQAEYGSTPTSFVPYDNNKYFEENVKLSDTMIAEIEGLTNKGSLQVVIAGSSVIVNNEDGLSRFYVLAKSNQNRNFNYLNATLNGTTIKDSTDDIAPQRLRINTNDAWTVGANHGWPCYKVSVGSLAKADIGSIWTDGNRQFTLAMVDTSYAYFIFPCTKSGESFIFNDSAPIANLSHVSGATHTSTVSISGGSSDQVYPSVNHNTEKIIINGNEITDDGTYYCDGFDIIEHYEIIDYAKLNTYLKAHIGSSIEDVKNNIDSVLALDYVYHITTNGEVIYSCATAIEETCLANSGFLQGYVLSSNGNTVYRYVNGVKNGSTFASSNLVDMTNYSTTNYIYKTDLIDGAKPTNRCVDIAKDSNNEIKYGFAFGFIPDLSDGSDAKRASLDSTFVWDMRNSKKSYPLCASNKSLAVGQCVNVVGYRYYMIPPQDITNITVLPIGNETYIIIDAHTLATGNILLNSFGNSVNVLDSSQMNVSDVVGSKGITYNTLASYSYAILKVN